MHLLWIWVLFFFSSQPGRHIVCTDLFFSGVHLWETFTLLIFAASVSLQVLFPQLACYSYDTCCPCYLVIPAAVMHSMTCCVVPTLGPRCDVLYILRVWQRPTELLQSSTPPFLSLLVGSTLPLLLTTKYAGLTEGGGAWWKKRGSVYSGTKQNARSRVLLQSRSADRASVGSLIMLL